MNPTTNRLWLRRILLVVSVIVLVWAAMLLWRSTTFHIVSTNPSTGNVSTAAPFFKINLNRELSTKNFQYTASSSLVTSYHISGKTVDFELNPPMNANQSYYIKIISLADTGGHILTNKTLSFVPRYIASQDLPEDQQQALQKLQTQRTPSKQTISFSGFDSLTNSGLTVSQINDLQQEFFSFTPNAKSVAVDASSVAPGPHDPNSTAFTLVCSVKVDGTTYNATLTYSDLDNVALSLVNPQTGATVYNSTQ